MLCSLTCTPPSPSLYTCGTRQEEEEPDVARAYARVREELLTLVRSHSPVDVPTMAPHNFYLLR